MRYFIKPLILSHIFVLLLASYVFAQGEGLVISEATIATKIENLIPWGASKIFSPNVTQLFAFSKVLGIKNQTSIKHVWYYRNNPMGEVVLDIKPPAWRTYSSKIIKPKWTGNWRVDMITQKGKILKSLHFTIE